ncbi:MAG: cupin domain-containing protein [Actinobacteria bacterium]|uniref:Unannotated protein n=1 Tax=freshwater metagenome TaxID=449393 RepID=A0A6J6BQL5_9ZZZZ|nr:cupin domain-containing protein [Actinomycetota bacterium]
MTITDETTTTDRALWMLNSLMIERLTAEQTGGAYSVHEQWITPAGNPPPHQHTHEDEAFVVLEGEVDFMVGGAITRVGTGGFAFAPRGIPHTYAVVGDSAHLYVITSPGLERFFRELGEPAGALSLPEPSAPDVARVVEVAGRHGIEILPPPA